MFVLQLYVTNKGEVIMSHVRPVNIMKLYEGLDWLLADKPVVCTVAKTALTLGICFLVAKVFCKDQHNPPTPNVQVRRIAPIVINPHHHEDTPPVAIPSTSQASTQPLKRQSTLSSLKRMGSQFKLAIKKKE